VGRKALRTESEVLLQDESLLQMTYKIIMAVPIVKTNHIDALSLYIKSVSIYIHIFTYLLYKYAHI